MPNQGKPTFCPACWGCFTDGGIRRHILSAHLWCQRCNIVGPHRKIKGHIPECLAACACVACGAAWDATAGTRHNFWGEGMAHPATEMGRFCADGCGAWLGDREAARRHHAGCGGIAEELRTQIPGLATEFVMVPRRARAGAARTAASSFMQKGSQMWHDLDRFRNFLEVCVVGQPLSADEYLAKVRAGTPLNPGEWILCRAEQARAVLSAGPLQRAMLVPQGARQTSTKDDVMACDEQRQQIDLHDQAAKNPNREV
ncbi:hypothetical protein QBC33DRAFT_520028 [Phialemonium atrogriseum]|uniref:Uncharacterized protein n=1 Tax=Phialemonium atrogriseum TaxID=1093897 RepID=A0AAJ0BR75_9PEZI|nr:uncharacterized protein QBC33DRAFT_520028 [Phialemonium atrogriseum]KAK1761913.1 hypothetical protein QBC33DRAFT_520028 [Phialemonium atrogriseum]